MSDLYTPPSDLSDLPSLSAFYTRLLREDCLPFWFPRALDTQNGGFYHCFAQDGELVDSDKSVWAQGRMSWMLLTLYRDVEQNPDWLAWAESGLRFLDEHGYDAEDGRMFFHLEADGSPIRKRRYAFSECFAAIVYALHAGITGSEDSKAKALHALDIFLDINFTPGKMAPKFTSQRPALGLSPRIMTIVTMQELRASLGDNPIFNDWINRCIDEIRTLFYKPDLGVLMEMVAPDGSIINHFDGRTLNPGHGIEGAWFILEEARYRGNDPELIDFACEIIDGMFARGWDAEHGGLLYFIDVYGKPVQEYWHNMKFWWPHDEALIATLLAYVLTNKPDYLEKHKLVLEWSLKHLQDREHGEWFGYLNRDGSPSSTLKGSLWKSFFHHPRALYACAKYAQMVVK